MKRIALLQKYLMPYRVPLFNAIANHPDIELNLVYYGTKEECRKSTLFSDKRFHEIQCRTFGFATGYDTNFNFPLSLYHELKNLRPDLVICAPDFGGLISRLYAKSYGARYIIWSEATPVTEAKAGYPKKLLRRWIYSNAWRFVVPGALAEKYIKSFIPNALIFYANNSIDEDCFKISKSDLMEKFNKEKLQITFSGSLIPKKGIAFLLEGFRKLLVQKPELRDKCALIILGAGPLDLGQYHEHNATFAGFCEGKTYIDFIKSSHVFILPSLSDRNPLTAIEALFSGNCVIVSEAVGSHPELVNGNGMVIRSGSADEVFKALANILELPRKNLIDMALKSLALSNNFTTRMSTDGFLSAILG